MKISNIKKCGEVMAETSIEISPNEIPCETLEQTEGFLNAIQSILHVLAKEDGAGKNDTKKICPYCLSENIILIGKKCKIKNDHFDVFSICGEVWECLQCKKIYDTFGKKK